jgi:hypothetical protein
MSMAMQESAVDRAEAGGPIRGRDTVLCCDCGRRIKAADSKSADAQHPPTPEDMARLYLVGPVRGLHICTDREACKAALSRTRFYNFILACKGTKALREPAFGLFGFRRGRG